MTTVARGVKVEAEAVARDGDGLTAKERVCDALATWDETYGSCKDRQTFEVIALRAILEGLLELVPQPSPTTS